MEEQKWKPAIISAKIDPSPVNVNDGAILSILVIDSYGYERTEPIYSNEFLLNEV